MVSGRSWGRALFFLLCLMWSCLWSEGELERLAWGLLVFVRSEVRSCCYTCWLAIMVDAGAAKRRDPAMWCLVRRWGRELVSCDDDFWQWDLLSLSSWSLRPDLVCGWWSTDVGLVLKTKQQRDERPWFGRFPDPTRKGWFRWVSIRWWCAVEDFGLVKWSE